MSKLIVSILCMMIAGCSVLDGPSHFTEGPPYWGGEVNPGGTFNPPYLNGEH